jgi:hypothetical protein
MSALQIAQQSSQLAERLTPQLQSPTRTIGSPELIAARSAATCSLGNHRLRLLRRNCCRVCTRVRAKAPPVRNCWTRRAHARRATCVVDRPLNKHVRNVWQHAGPADDEWMLPHHWPAPLVAILLPVSAYTLSSSQQMQCFYYVCITSQTDPDYFSVADGCSGHRDLIDVICVTT